MGGERLEVGKKSTIRAQILVQNILALPKISALKIETLHKDNFLQNIDLFYHGSQFGKWAIQGNSKIISSYWGNVIYPNSQCNDMVVK